MMLASNLVNIGIMDAAIVALLGYAVVFFGLILLQMVIVAMGKYFISKDKKAAEAASAAKASVSKEIKAYCRGEYGTTPAPINPEIQAQILGDEKPLEGRYADTLAPVVETSRKELGDLAKCDEDVLSYIAFPNLAEKFLEERKIREENEATYSIVEC